MEALIDNHPRRIAGIVIGSAIAILNGISPLFAQYWQSQSSGDGVSKFLNIVRLDEERLAFNLVDRPHDYLYARSHDTIWHSVGKTYVNATAMSIYNLVCVPRHLASWNALFGHSVLIDTLQVIGREFIRFADARRSMSTEEVVREACITNFSRDWPYIITMLVVLLAFTLGLFKIINTLRRFVCFLLGSLSRLLFASVFGLTTASDSNATDDRDGSGSGTRPYLPPQFELSSDVSRDAAVAQLQRQRQALDLELKVEKEKSTDLISQLDEFRERYNQVLRENSLLATQLTTETETQANLQSQLKSERNQRVELKAEQEDSKSTISKLESRYKEAVSKSDRTASLLETEKKLSAAHEARSKRDFEAHQNAQAKLTEEVESLLTSVRQKSDDFADLSRMHVLLAKEKKQVSEKLIILEAMWSNQNDKAFRLSQQETWIDETRQKLDERERVLDEKEAEVTIKATNAGEQQPTSTQSVQDAQEGKSASNEHADVYAKQLEQLDAQRKENDSRERHLTDFEEHLASRESLLEDQRDRWKRDRKQLVEDRTAFYQQKAKADIESAARLLASQNMQDASTQTNLLTTRVDMRSVQDSSTQTEHSTSPVDSRKMQDSFTQIERFLPPIDVRTMQDAITQTEITIHPCTELGANDNGTQSSDVQASPPQDVATTQAEQYFRPSHTTVQNQPAQPSICLEEAQPPTETIQEQSPPSADIREPPICEFFLRNPRGGPKQGCRFGDKCRFVHPPLDQVNTIRISRGMPPLNNLERYLDNIGSSSIHADSQHEQTPEQPQSLSREPFSYDFRSLSHQGSSPHSLFTSPTDNPQGIVLPNQSGEGFQVATSHQTGHFPRSEDLHHISPHPLTFGLSAEELESCDMGAFEPESQPLNQSSNVKDTEISPQKMEWESDPMVNIESAEQLDDMQWQPVDDSPALNSSEMLAQSQMGFEQSSASGTLPLNMHPERFAMLQHQMQSPEVLPSQEIPASEYRDILSQHQTQSEAPVEETSMVDSEDEEFDDDAQLEQMARNKSLHQSSLSRQIGPSQGQEASPHSVRASTSATPEPTSSTAHPFDEVDYSMPDLDLLPPEDYAPKLVERFVDVAIDAVDIVQHPGRQTYNVEQRQREIDTVFTEILQDYSKFVSYGKHQQEVDDMANEIGRLTKEMTESLERFRAGEPNPYEQTKDSDDQENEENEEGVEDDEDEDDEDDDDEDVEDDDEDDEEEEKKENKENSWIDEAIEEAKTGPRQKYADPNAADASSSQVDAPMT